MQRAPVLGLERAALRWREPVGGETPVGELAQRRTDPRQPLAELGRERAADGLHEPGPHDAQRRAQERAALPLALGRAPRADQRVGLTPGEAVALDRAGDALLRAARHAAQGEGQRRAEPAVVDPRRDARREGVCEQEPGRDPGRLAPEEPLDRLRAEPVLLA